MDGQLTKVQILKYYKCCMFTSRWSSHCNLLAWEHFEVTRCIFAKIYDVPNQLLLRQQNNDFIDHTWEIM